MMVLVNEIFTQRLVADWCDKTCAVVQTHAAVTWAWTVSNHEIRGNFQVGWTAPNALQVTQMQTQLNNNNDNNNNNNNNIIIIIK